MSREVQPLVSTKWLSEKLEEIKNDNNPPLRILDATFNPHGKPGVEIYREGHIPGSLHFDLEECRDKESPFKYTLPPADVFSDYVSRHGISNETHVVIYENDPIFKAKTAERVWWMFRYFGHDRVSVLDGGLKAWVHDRYKVTSGVTEEARGATFVPVLRPHLLMTYQQVIEDLQTGTTQLLDSRPQQWFDGSRPGLWPDMKLGIIKSAINLPFTEFLETDSTKFKSPAEIKSVFESKGIDVSKPLTTTCNIGITACIAAMAAFLVGNKNVAIFDGSWDEFSVRGPENLKEING